MTNDLAIRILGGAILGTTEQTHEAVAMAIKALSALPSASDLIDRRAAIDAYGDWYVEEGTEEGFIGTVKQLLEGLPSADIQEELENAYMHGYTAAEARYRDTLRHGYWIESDTDGFVCSVCRNGYRNQPTLMGKPMFEYCPVCGARMDGEQNE